MKETKVKKGAKDTKGTKAAGKSDKDQGTKKRGRPSAASKANDRTKSRGKSNTGNKSARGKSAAK